MAYQKTIWSPGDTISSARLNNIENGIEGLETEVAAASQVDTTLTVSGKAADAKTTGDQLSELKNGIAPIFSKSNAYSVGIKTINNRIKIIKTLKMKKNKIQNSKN